jgi:hypothetical protein
MPPLRAEARATKATGDPRLRVEKKPAPQLVDWPLYSNLKTFSRSFVHDQAILFARVALRRWFCVALSAADTKTEPSRSTRPTGVDALAGRQGREAGVRYQRDAALAQNRRSLRTLRNPYWPSIFLLDPAKKSKTLVFDNAKMAAMLTAITRTPFEAAHLPIRSIKFVKNDTIVQFSVQVAKDTDINGTQRSRAVSGRRGSAGGRQNQDDANDIAYEDPQQRPPNAEPPPNPGMRTLYFEYEIATGK